MDNRKRSALRKAGFSVGGAKSFLGPSGLDTCFPSRKEARKLYPEGLPCLYFTALGKAADENPEWACGFDCSFGSILFCSVECLGEWLRRSGMDTPTRKGFVRSKKPWFANRNTQNMCPCCLRIFWDK